MEEAQLTGLVCPRCGTVNLPPIARCLNCQALLAEAEPKPLSGKGRVYTYTVVHVPPAHLTEKAPYTLVIVELAEGPRLTARLEDPAEDTSLEIGTPVTLVGQEDGAYIFRLEK